MNESDNRGNPISYQVLERGTPVFDSTGKKVGEVEKVLAVDEKDVFDGIVVKTGVRHTRFVDADEIGPLYERRVELKIAADELEGKPAHESGTVVYQADTDEESTTKSFFRRLRQGRPWQRRS